ncbi:MAG TPA: maleylpyruvate isomerase family mycothiol-dependent enzyme [Acidimicrobiia bacterium]|nr:maleylpyruvate isomerase family mycothiol-dependent enzyme [Acidimicrobiia bacterium]
MTDFAAAYRGVRERVSALVAPIGDDVDHRPVPATPEWTARDVLAHLVGVAADVLAGNLQGAGTDPWTARQVEERRDRSVTEMLAEWEVSAATVEAVMNDFGPPAGQLVFDAVTHEYDLCGAFGIGADRSSDALAIGFDWLCGSRASGTGGALRLVTEAGSHEYGPGDPVATVEAERFELFRGATGRRSRAQMVAWRWDPEPHPELVVLASLFTMRATDLVE